jgi:DNA invertase Pin-like site-specific DNA recombinase
MRLLGDVEKGNIDTIFFTKLDRWTRNVAYFYEIQQILDAHNVKWKTILESYSTVTPEDVFKLNIMLSVSQHEASVTAERVKFTLGRKIARGEWRGGTPPVGYKLDCGKVVKDETTREAMEAFFDTMSRTYSVKLAMAEAEKRGLRLRLGTAYNYIRYGKEKYCGTVNHIPAEPYISEEDIDRILSNLKSQTKRKEPNRTYLFSGLVRCSDCKRKFLAHAGGAYKGRQERKRYRCGQRINGNVLECKNGVYISEKDIEKDLLENLETHLDYCKLKLKASEETALFDIAERKRQQLEQKKSRLTDAFLDGIIEKSAFSERMKAIDEELQAIPFPRHRKRITPAAEVIVKGWQEIYSELNDENKRSFWLSIIDTIWIYPDRSISVDFLVV